MKTINYLTFILICLSALLITSSCDSFRKGYVQGLLQATVKEVNKTCPNMLDAETRMDSATLPAGEKTIRYHYTLVHFTAAQLDTNLFKDKLTPGMVSSIKIQKELKAIRDNNITMQYSYYGSDKDYICMINITPDKYTAK
ncbi:MAG: hypothetical protein JWO03_4013 [Bacteroidetes bacterium]|nr:hypothetical protein [Bacteroidota bacterium]